MEINLPNPIALPPRASPAAQPAEALQRRKLAQEFTAFLYQEVLKAMRAAMPQDSGIEGESMSRDFFTSMMDAEVARVVARRDSSGVAKAVEKTFERIPIEPGKTQPASNYPAATLPVPPSLPAPGMVSSSFGERRARRRRRSTRGLAPTARVHAPIRSTASASSTAVSISRRRPVRRSTP